MNDERLKWEILTVKTFAEVIGYGNTMAIASALWRRSLIEQGLPESGAHVVASIYGLKAADKKLHEKEKKLYDQFIKTALGDGEK